MIILHQQQEIHTYFLMYFHWALQNVPTAKVGQDMQDRLDVNPALDRTNCGNTANQEARYRVWHGGTAS